MPTEIGIVSDTHDFFDPNLIKIFETVDEIWHAGDFGTMEVAEELSKIKPLRGVFGNIDTQDIREAYPENLMFEIGGVSILMTHIAGRPGRYDPRVRELLEDQQPDVLVCGHSHLLRVEKVKQYDDMRHINPGAAGHHGSHLVRTVLKCQIADGNLGKLRVIELGPRGRPGRQTRAFD